MKFTVPNQLTLLRILLIPFFLFYFTQSVMSQKLTGTIIFFVAAATDWYDGYIARRFNIITRWGQFMDPLADKLLISSALIAFAWIQLLQWWMVIAIITRDVLITSLRLFALQMGKSIVTSMLAKWKTFLQMTAIFVFLIYLNFPQAAIYQIQLLPPAYLFWTSLMFLFVTLFTLYTGLQYLIENRNHVIEIFRRILKLFD
jgi:CDP-diacylglycerol--glycerol-3-phosphate 3-phosphatidyltransferase